MCLKLFSRRIVIAVGSIVLLAASIQVLLAGQITLTWDANQEEDLAGYRIYYGSVSRQYNKSVYVGNSTIFSVQGLEMDKLYYFAVTAIDYSGNESDYSEEVSGVVTKEDSTGERENDVVFSGLSYNFPNPFSPGSSTSIRYELQADATVTIRIYDLNNQLVTTIVKDEYKLAGEHIEDKWNGLNNFGDPVAAGVYLCQIETGNQNRIIKIAVMP